MRHQPATPDMTYRQLAYLWAAFLALVLLVNHYRLDLRIADTLYALEGGSWQLRHNFFTSEVIHQWGKSLSIGLALANLAALAIAFSSPRWRIWRKPLIYLFLTALASTLLVSLLKHITNTDCPWDLVRYGGDRPYLTFWQSRPESLPRAACFPAGHASAGYTWLALYFFFTHPALKGQYRHLRWWGLACGLSMGLVFGIGQQLRGAHFLSHDLWTLMICWTTGNVLALLTFAEQPSTPFNPKALVPYPTTGESGNSD